MPKKATWKIGLKTIIRKITRVVFPMALKDVSREGETRPFCQNTSLTINFVTFHHFCITHTYYSIIFYLQHMHWIFFKWQATYNPRTGISSSENESGSSSVPSSGLPTRKENSLQTSHKQKCVRGETESNTLSDQFQQYAKRFVIRKSLMGPSRWTCNICTGPIGTSKTEYYNWTACWVAQWNS